MTKMTIPIRWGNTSILHLTRKSIKKQFKKNVN